MAKVHQMRGSSLPRAAERLSQITLRVASRTMMESRHCTVSLYSFQINQRAKHCLIQITTSLDAAPVLEGEQRHSLRLDPLGVTCKAPFSAPCSNGELQLPLRDLVSIRINVR